jgi:predicted nucleotidyltransferase
LLTGIHLMQTGEVQAHLPTLNDEFKLPYIPDLIAYKVGSREYATLSDVDVAFHTAEYERLLGALEAASAASPLPDEPSAKPALNDLLLRVRGIDADALK